MIVLRVVSEASQFLESGGGRLTTPRCTRQRITHMCFQRRPRQLLARLVWMAVALVLCRGANEAQEQDSKLARGLRPSARPLRCCSGESAHVTG